MLAVVCKTQTCVQALETYDKEINKISGLHKLGTSIGRSLDDQFLVICLENVRLVICIDVPVLHFGAHMVLFLPL